MVIVWDRTVEMVPYGSTNAMYWRWACRFLSIACLPQLSQVSRPYQFVLGQCQPNTHSDQALLSLHNPVIFKVIFSGAKHFLNYRTIWEWIKINYLSFRISLYIHWRSHVMCMGDHGPSSPPPPNTKKKKSTAHFNLFKTRPQ